MRSLEKGQALPAERSREQAASEVSAGGVVIRGREVIAIVPRRRAADGRRVLGLPKGHVDEGETPLQAAMREVREEAGVQVDLLAELGEVRYWYTRKQQRISKVVAFYLFRYLEGDVADHDEEVEEARWLPLEEAQRSLSYPGEREIVGRAIELLTQAGQSFTLAAEESPRARVRPSSTSDARKDR